MQNTGEYEAIKYAFNIQNSFPITDRNSNEVTY